MKIVRKRRGTGRLTYYARYVDPETCRETQENLNTLGRTDDASRRDFCIRLSKYLARRREDALLGRPAPPPNKSFHDASIDFYAEKTAEGVKPRVVKDYARCVGELVAWANHRGLVSMGDLTPALLSEFRSTTIRRPARRSFKGRPQKHAKRPKGQAKIRGLKVEGKCKRARTTVNKTLTLCRSFLGFCRRRGWTPDLNTDNVKDTLRLVTLKAGDRRDIDYLQPVQIQELLKAALRHDAATFDLTREERIGGREPGTTPRHPPIAPFVLTCLLSGMRFSEAAGLTWHEVDLARGLVRLPKERVKTGKAREIPLDITPALSELLTRMKLRSGDGKHVFGPMTRDVAERARDRLVGDRKRHYNAPSFTWHQLRRTCGTVLTCAPNIYGAASAFLSAKRLGHSVAVAETHYAGALHGLPKEAETFEAAVGIEAVSAKIIAASGGEAVKPVKDTA